MRTLKRFGPAIVLGLTMAVAGISFAQNASVATGDDKQSCCCVSSGGCGDSCDMKKKDGATHHATADDKNSCCGDSCQMMKKNAVRNHAASTDKEGCCGCCGDSCQMKDGAKTKAQAVNTAGDKHECCCCGDSCNMKDKNMKSVKDTP